MNFVQNKKTCFSKVFGKPLACFWTRDRRKQTHEKHLAIEIASTDQQVRANFFSEDSTIMMATPSATVGATTGQRHFRGQISDTLDERLLLPCLSVPTSGRHFLRFHLLRSRRARESYSTDQRVFGQAKVRCPRRELSKIDREHSIRSFALAAGAVDDIQTCAMNCLRPRSTKRNLCSRLLRTFDHQCPSVVRVCGMFENVCSLVRKVLKCTRPATDSQNTHKLHWCCDDACVCCRSNGSGKPKICARIRFEKCCCVCSLCLGVL